MKYGFYTGSGVKLGGDECRRILRLQGSVYLMNVDSLSTRRKFKGYRLVQSEGSKTLILKVWNLYNILESLSKTLIRLILSLHRQA